MEKECSATSRPDPHDRHGFDLQQWMKASGKKLPGAPTARLA